MSICILFLLLLTNLKEYDSVMLRGNRAYDGQFPWLIQFQTIIPCGGILILSDWVLTAAQCVQDKRNSILLLATGLNGTRSIQTISIKASYVHPQYEAYSVLPDRDHNIALLKLIKPFDMHNTKIILPNIVPVKYDNNYKSCLIFGWQSYISPSSKVLAKPIQYNEVILNSWKLCTYMIKTNATYTNVFCTMVEFKDDIKACAGNPGSPVICENQYRESSLLGIASWTNFALECGILPTYLYLDEFRIWIHDIIFNNKKAEEQENNAKSSETHSKFKDTVEMHKNLQNNTNFIQTDYWSKDTKMQSQNASTITLMYQNISTAYINTSHFWNKLYLPVYNDLNGKNASSSHGYQEILYTDIIKEPSNNIYRYKEIGKIEIYQNQNQSLEKLDKHNQPKNLHKSLLCNDEKFNKTTMSEHHQIELDDFEYLLPFNFEDITTSYSSITIIYTKHVYLLYFILSHVFYFVLYM